MSGDGPPKKAPIESVGTKLELAHEVLVSFAHSPALHYNNLCYGAGKVVFNGQSDAVIVGVGALPDNPTRSKLGLPANCGAAASTIIPLKNDQGCALVVVNSVGQVQFWDVQTETLTVSAPIFPSEVTYSHGSFRGIARVLFGGKEVVCVATAAAELALVSTNSSPALVGCFRVSNTPLACIASTTEATSYLACSDHSGAVCLFDCKGEMPTLVASAKVEGAVTTSLRFIGTRWLVAAQGHGMVVVYDLKRCDLSGSDGSLVRCVEIDAHPRWINACDVAGSEELFYAVTVAEDNLLQLWKFDMSGGAPKVELLAHYVRWLMTLCDVMFVWGSVGGVSCSRRAVFGCVCRGVDGCVDVMWTCVRMRVSVRAYCGVGECGWVEFGAV